MLLGRKIIPFFQHKYLNIVIFIDHFILNLNETEGALGNGNPKA